jgi:hypothetical protein
MLTHNYIIPSLGGRLGNNLFMIAHVYAKGLKYNKQVVINKSQLSYEGNDYSQNIFSKLEFIDSSPDNGNYNPIIPSEDKHSIYGGYYQSESYFEEYSENIKSLFSAPLDFINRIRTEIPVIFEKTVTVINVRRGDDYLQKSNYHPVISADYIKVACDKIHNTQQYLVASDDIAWCKENLELPNAIYLEGYKPEEQLWILSMCHNFIISNSSFSWWAAYLSRHPNKIVIAPQTWYGPEGLTSWNEIYCKDWTVLPTYFKDGFIYPNESISKKYTYKIILKTTNKNLSRVDSCADTWLKGLDFVCLTDKLSGKYSEISGSSREEYDSAEEKTVHMINLVKETSEFDNYDWLVFIDDDAILNVKLWETIIQHLNKDNAYGLYMHGVYQPQPTLLYPSGGAGYFISPQKIKASNLMTNKEWGVEDAAIGKWLEENSIKLLDHYFINGKYEHLLLNGWFPFPKEYDKVAVEDINTPQYAVKLLEKIDDHEEKKQWINKHLTHHYIRHKEFMEYINNAFNG